MKSLCWREGRDVLFQTSFLSSGKRGPKLRVKVETVLGV